MKEVKAIIQPFMKDKVLNALLGLEGLPGITVSEVIGCGKTPCDDSDQHAGNVFVPKTKLEVVVSDELVDVVVDTIAESARTGRLGDGKIFVSDVQDTVKIRTGERGIDAV